jgi:hypothetical protein
MFQERISELSAIPGIDARKHRGALVQVCYFEILTSVIRQWIMSRGAIRCSGKYKDQLQPVLAQAAVWEKLLMNAYRALGLTPRDQGYTKVQERTFSDWIAEAGDDDDDDAEDVADTTSEDTDTPTPEGGDNDE